MARAKTVPLAYGTVLVLLVLSMVTSIASTGFESRLVWAGVLQGLALLVTLQVSQARRTALYLASLAGIAMTAVGASLSGNASTSHSRFVPAIWALVVLGTIFAIGRHIVGFGRVDMQTVLGLLCVYVLLGLLFAYVFMLAGTPERPFFTSDVTDLGSYVYFSYVTLATVGYGDLVAAVGLPRALAVAEAIIGQLYLVSVVALAVSRFSGRPGGYHPPNR